MRPAPPAIARLRAAVAGLAATRRGQISNGREVVGTFVPLAPPAEIIEAAGAHPYRLLAAGGADADLRGMGILGRDACAYCRSVVGAAACDRPPVTCVASGTVCDRLRRAGDAWPRETGLPLFALHIPRTREGPDPAGDLAEEFQTLSAEISVRTGVAATPERLAGAIERGNRVREILGAADRARREDPPRITGNEFMDIVRAAQGFSSGEFLEGAAGLVEEMRGAEPPHPAPVRLLLVGPTLPDGPRDVVDLAEEDAAALFVADLTDSGSLGYGAPVEESGDPFLALARQVLAHPIHAAPARPATAFRERFTVEIASARPDGIVFRGVPFCRPWNLEPGPLRELSPVPFLDVRVDGAGGGQLRTRVGAFVEMLMARRRREAAS